MKWFKQNLVWVLNGLCISAFLIVFEPFGTTFRNISAIILAISYGILSVATLIILNKTLKRYLFKTLSTLKPISVYAIWYTVVLTAISLINFFYFGLWACHCESTYKLSLLLTQFAPRTFTIGGFLIMIDRMLEYFPINTDTSAPLIVNQNKNIVAISSFGNYLKIKKIEDNKLVETLERGTLMEIEKKYSSNFFRCHRSHIINTHYIKKVIKEDRRYLAILALDITIPVSTSKAAGLVPLVKA